MVPRVFEAFLYEIPFISMIVSAVEVFPNECLGLLLGYRAWNSLDKTRRAIVEQAIAYQTAERKRNEAEIGRKPEFRCKDMFYKLYSWEPIGDFHSHPNAKASLSNGDKKSMEIGDIEIIIGIAKKRRTSYWRYSTSKKELSGVFGDYRFEIAVHSCFRSKEGPEKFQRIDLLCPFALGIGSKYIDVNVELPQ